MRVGCVNLAEPTLSQDVLEAVPAWGATLLERLEIVEKMVCDNRESLVHVTAMIIEKDEEFVDKVLGMMRKAMEQGLKEWSKVTKLEARVIKLERLWNQFLCAEDCDEIEIKE